MKEILTLPRVFDHHSHLSYAALLSSCPDLSGCASDAEAAEILGGLSNPDFNIVIGWHSGRIHLSEELMDSLPPAVVINFSLHGFVCNKKAAAILRKAGINPEPQTVLEAERAMPQLLGFFPNYAMRGRSENGLLSVIDHYIRELMNKGIYGIDDMLYVTPFIDSRKLKKRASRCGFKLAVREALPLDGSEPNGCSARSGKDGRLRLKLFADGAVGAGSAAVSEGFLEGKGSPVLIYDAEGMEKALTECIKREADTAVHAIGDLACGQVLEAYRKLGPLPSGSKFSLRLEHCQFITLEQAVLAKGLGVSLCLQPNFNEDSVTYEDRLSKNSCKRNNPLRMLIDEAGFVPGKDLLFGSDGMPSGLAPALENILFPPYPGQRLSIDELLDGYSANSDYGTDSYEVDSTEKTVTILPSAG